MESHVIAALADFDFQQCLSANVQLINQADNAAFGDFGLLCRFCAALRLIKSLGTK